MFKQVMMINKLNILHLLKITHAAYFENESKRLCYRTEFKGELWARHGGTPRNHRPPLRAGVGGLKVPAQETLSQNKKKWERKKRERQDAESRAWAL